VKSFTIFVSTESDIVIFVHRYIRTYQGKKKQKDGNISAADNTQSLCQVHCCPYVTGMKTIY